MRAENGAFDNGSFKKLIKLMELLDTVTRLGDFFLLLLFSDPLCLSSSLDLHFF
jgi:hypothetical protein